ncbi:MAG: hypothetical protein D6720_07940 [Gammaproteobacteria bacterium]|nr:MAG: hypothetical protein D6720_07940 [Gammaproteobacteria bacterium]
MKPHDRQVHKKKDVSAIEADVAYFGARIAFAERGEQTVYKQAQRKACEALSRALQAKLERLRRE